MVGGCSGVLIAEDVMLTAGHCFPQLATGCGRFDYQQPNAPGAPLPSFSARFLVVGSQYTTGDAGGFDPSLREVAIDGIVFHPGYILANATGQSLVDLCCPNQPAATCILGVCFPNAPASNWNPGVVVHDLALVHLAEPVLDIPPMKVAVRLVAPGSFANEAKGEYALDVSSLVNEIGIVVGTSFIQNPDPDASPNDPYRHRAYGPMLMTSTEHFGDVSMSCDPTTPNNQPYSCTDGCSIRLASSGTGFEGSCVVGGDSGGAFVLNATDEGGSAIPGWSGKVSVGLISSGNATNADPESDCTVGTGDDAYEAAARVSPTFDAMFDSGNPPGLPTGSTENGTWLGARMRDFDGDGVVNGLDNCPVVANPGQENCNLHAEQARGYPWRGDACDPIPCPAAELHPPEKTIFSTVGSQFFYHQVVHVRRERHRVAPLGSSYWGAGSDEGEVLFPPESVGPVSTTYMFCQKMTEPQQDCGPNAIGDVFQIVEPGNTPLLDRPYYPATQTYGVGLGPTFTSETLDYPSAGVERKWQSANDLVEWRDVQGWISTDIDDLDDLDGRFWWHGATTKGTYADPVAVTLSPPHPTGTGYRVKHDGVTADGSQLCNHYEHVDPFSIESHTLAFAVAEVPDKWWLWWRLPDEGEPLTGWDGVLAEDSLLVPVVDGHFGVLRRDGVAIVADDRLGASLKSRLSDDTLQWAAASESRLNIGPLGVDTGYVAVAIDDKGHDLVDGAFLASGALGAVADLGLTPLPRKGRLSPRRGAKLVYSRSEDAVWIVGGKHGKGSSYTNEIVTRDVVGPRPWTKLALPASYEPRDVLAATWSFRDHRLWVLDEHVVGGTLVARLARVRKDGQVQVVGEWPRSGKWNRQWLELDLEGDVLLVSSSTTLGKHAIVRFVARPYLASAPVAIDPMGVASGELALPIVVDRRGMTRFVRATSATPTLFTVVRSTSVRGEVPAGLTPASVL